MRSKTIGFWALIALGAALLLWIVAWALTPEQARWMGPGAMPWMYGAGVGWPAMGLMMVSMIIFWGAIIAGIIVAIRWAIERDGEAGDTETNIDALEVVRRRYARGEISREEYERLCHDLVSTG
ncbi:MAG: hypothetical protein KatS3mg057_2820 [Herpetosiphonaceae bacterium]|nr:MAG: hypothetical protein KatS3mg057_2820 [Herpetosiphonaceae bacterium]